MMVAPSLETSGLMIAVASPTIRQIFHQPSHSLKTPADHASIAVAAITATWKNGLSAMRATAISAATSRMALAGCLRWRKVSLLV